MKTLFSNYKTLKLVTLSIFAMALLASCSNDDTPALVNEEEVITTLKLTLTPQGGGSDIVFQLTDSDGDGSNAPVITDGFSLSASTQYTGTVEFLNELQDPAEDITEEVIEESNEFSPRDFSIAELTKKPAKKSPAAPVQHQHYNKKHLEN